MPASFSDTRYSHKSVASSHHVPKRIIARSFLFLSADRGQLITSTTMKIAPPPIDLSSFQEHNRLSPNDCAGVGHRFPYLVIEVLKTEAIKCPKMMSMIKFQGGLHISRRPFISAVYVLEASTKQLYWATNLHMVRTVHG